MTCWSSATRAGLSSVVSPARLLSAAADAGEIPYELMRGVGGLCAGADGNTRYGARRLVGLLVAGLRMPR
ncbi:hypothetical protein CLV71_1336 [Actinophytocola oryzae]|uniref:Uncharacterized protein n=1 Tax=Actinophytocola oryzae TaxID=502181 RepID=A0A4R7UR35_9PSEU|nr:hypothetical protein CLV71_1336 [Actinophytocola oryzae]